MFINDYLKIIKATSAVCKNVVVRTRFSDEPNSIGFTRKRPRQYDLQSVGVKNQVNCSISLQDFPSNPFQVFSRSHECFSLVNSTTLPSSFLLSRFFLFLSLLFSLFLSPIPFSRFFFQFIYFPLRSILAAHVQVGLGGFLSVPSGTSWNFLWAAVRLLPHCSGITSTLMRPESWLRGH